MALFKKPVTVNAREPKQEGSAIVLGQSAEAEVGERRSGIDFKKLLDPEWQAQVRAEREADEARQQALNTRIRAAIDLCLRAEGGLSDQERRFVSKANYLVNSFSILTEKQEGWLLDLAERFQPGFKGAYPVPDAPKKAKGMSL